MAQPQGGCSRVCAQVAQLQAERSALAAQSEQHRSGLEAKTGDIARMAGQLADAQAQSHSMSQQVTLGPPEPSMSPSCHGCDTLFIAARRVLLDSRLLLFPCTSDGKI